MLHLKSSATVAKPISETNQMTSLGYKSFQNPHYGRSVKFLHTASCQSREKTRLVDDCELSIVHQ